MNYIYILIFIGGSGYNTPTTSFSQEFSEHKTCQEALADIKKMSNSFNMQIAKKSEL